MEGSSRGDIDPFIVMDVMEAARQAEASGRDIIHMEVGQPGTPAPAAARAAVSAAMEAGSLGYTVAMGLPELRARIARLYADWYGVSLDPTRVVVTSGASGAFILAFSALFDAGDKVALAVPGYPSYRQILRAMSVDPVAVPARVEDGFQLTAENVPDGVRGVIAASPANPTGKMLDREALSRLVAATEAKGATFISDEIYHGIEYEQQAVTALEVSDNVFVINSFSKYHSMTGWRVGWMVVPDAHIRRIERLAQNMFICAPHVAQVAALAAMDAGEELDRNVAVYKRNREILISGLPEAGLPNFAAPDGAFYIYADVGSYTDDSLSLARDVLERAGVAVTPGLDFDPLRGHKTLRLSYAGTTADIEEGLRRLGQYFRAL